MSTSHDLLRRSRFLLVTALVVSSIGYLGLRLWKYQQLAPLRRGISALKAGDYQSALAAIRPFAEDGNTLAERTLGEMYAFGLGVAEDDVQARIWLRRAECKCKEPGQLEYDVALNYAQGYGGKQDKVAALKWLRFAAEAGHPRAQELLGNREKLLKMGFADDPDLVEFWSRVGQSR